MGLDLFLTRAINDFAGETSWIDWTFLTLCEPDTLWLPCILLGSYWIVRWPREALVAAPVMTVLIGLVDFIGAQIKHVVARPRPCVSIAELHRLQACGGHFSFPSNHALNTATVAQLETIPGIGKATAERILEYRQKNGGFKKVEDLMNVRGIGEKSFLKIKPLITVATAKAER